MGGSTLLIFDNSQARARLVERVLAGRVWRYTRPGVLTMERYLWSRLNKQQVGAYAEYFIKMELTMHGFQVCGTEVDDRGIDFVARHEQGPFIEIQVKSLRSTGYVFLPKTKFELRKSLYLSLGLLIDGQVPQFYLIPSLVWKKPDPVFVDHDYEGLESKPEFGLNVSRRNLQALEPYRLERTVDGLCGAT